MSISFVSLSSFKLPPIKVELWFIATGEFQNQIVDAFRAADVARLRLPFVRATRGFDFKSSNDRPVFVVEPQFNCSAIRYAGHTGDEFGRTSASKIHFADFDIRAIADAGHINARTGTVRGFDSRFPSDGF